MDLRHDKYVKLKEQLAGFGSIVIAFSGGVDSTFLLTAAHKMLGEKAVAVTAAPAFVPLRELEEAAAFCRERSIRQIVIPAVELNLDDVRHNPPDRCYHCKKLTANRQPGLGLMGEDSSPFSLMGSCT